MYGEPNQAATKHFFYQILIFSSALLINYTHPEFYKEEGILGAFCIQLLQSAFLFWKFIVDLTNVHRLQQGVTVGMIRLPDVHKQVFVVLQE